MKDKQKNQPGVTKGHRPSIVWPSAICFYCMAQNHMLLWLRWSSAFTKIKYLLQRLSSLPCNSVDVENTRLNSVFELFSQHFNFFISVELTISKQVSKISISQI